MQALKLEQETLIQVVSSDSTSLDLLDGVVGAVEASLPSQIVALETQLLLLRTSHSEESLRSPTAPHPNAVGLGVSEQAGGLDVVRITEAETRALAALEEDRRAFKRAELRMQAKYQSN